jgi:hypothetical protein
VLEDNKNIINEVKAKLSKIKDLDKGDEIEGLDFDGEADPDKNEDQHVENNISNEDTNSNSGHEAKREEGSPTKKSKEKSLNVNQAALSTLYKTPTKDNMYQKSTKFKSFNFEKRTFTKYNCPLSHFDGYNLWLLKPTHLNRGRGIHIFKDLPTLHKLIKEYCQGKDEESWKKKMKPSDESPGKEISPTDALADQLEELQEIDTSNFNPNQLLEHQIKLQQLA